MVLGVIGAPYTDGMVTSDSYKSDMSVISVAPIESMARRALVKNLKNHIGNSLMAINNVPYLLTVAYLEPA